MDPGKIDNLLQIAGRHNGRILFQCTKERGFIASFGNDGQVDERWGCVIPALEAHPIGENLHYTPCPCRYPGSHLFQKCVGISP